MSQPSESEKKWMNAWNSAAAELEKIHIKELQEFNYEEKREAVLGLLELGYRFRQPRESSGMVEMQRLFKKARR